MLGQHIGTNMIWFPIKRETFLEEGWGDSFIFLPFWRNSTPIQKILNFFYMSRDSNLLYCRNCIEKNLGLGVKAKWGRLSRSKNHIELILKIFANPAKSISISILWPKLGMIMTRFKIRRAFNRQFTRILIFLQFKWNVCFGTFFGFILV